METRVVSQSNLLSNNGQYFSKEYQLCLVITNVTSPTARFVLDYVPNPQANNYTYQGHFRLFDKQEKATLIQLATKYYADDGMFDGGSIAASTTAPDQIDCHNPHSSILGMLTNQAR